jgi:hypothetical protein
MQHVCTEHREAGCFGSTKTYLYIETAQHAKQVSSVTRPLHTRLGTHAKLSPPTVTLTDDTFCGMIPLLSWQRLWESGSAWGETVLVHIHDSKDMHCCSMRPN